MRKTITQVFMGLLSIFGLRAVAQNAPIDFEMGGNGAEWTWTVFENDTNPSVEIISNPDQSGINTSSTVMKFTALQAGQAYAGTESLHGADIGTFSITEDNSVIKIMVWKTTISDIGIKLVTPSGAADPEIKVANTLVNQWEEITIDYSSRIGSPNATNVDQIVIFPDFTAREQDNIIYIDNITFSEGEATTEDEPMTAAPTPTLDPADVISLFSDPYTNINVDTWNTGWSAANYEEITIEGNPTKKYSILNFNGIEATNPSIDVTTPGMNNFHLDVWSPNSTEFRVKLVDFKGDGYQGANGDTEAELSFALTPNSWNSLDIPLSDFMNAGMTDMTDINQMVISSDPAGASTVYIDNVYFSSESTPQDEPMMAAPTPTLDPANVISLFSDPYTDVNVDTWNTGWSAANYEEVMIEGNPTKKYTALNFNGTETTNPSIDATTPGMMYFHMDVWTPNSNTFRVKLVDFKGDGFQGANGDTEAELSFAPNQGEWVSLDIPLSDFMNAGMTDMTDINQLVISSDPAGASTVFIDNVYFATEASLSIETKSNIITTVYPNPSTSNWNFVSEKIIEQAEIFDITGKKVLTEKIGNKQFTISGSHLPSGVYFAKLNTNQSFKTIKLIKN
ncbi:T9SS type A sorting domain-containing protein [Mesonia sp.]|uniref:T9SS type A sorting domain-containing protein n=1 Tax=Mesonia sp. TaxID=1960830 RepID=UPI00176E3A21|nr:T9SS type A sorting domain-containing protein [Mesonia sp.]HIB38251.1 T9SS type A sorting domain-containing protein [Mesonia sp.]